VKNEKDKGKKELDRMIEELIEKTRLIQKYENDNRESSRQKSVF
jgi:hypothetical protein